MAIDSLEQLNENLINMMEAEISPDLLGEYLIWRSIKPGSECPKCSGTGYDKMKKCKTCGGSGSRINKWS